MIPYVDLHLFVVALDALLGFSCGLLIGIILGFALALFIVGARELAKGNGEDGHVQ